MQLHPYQDVAVSHLQRCPRGALFLDMGLGKTAVTLRSLTPAHLPALVVAPKRVTENVWEDEAKKWRPDLRIAIAAGNPRQRHHALTDMADIVVIGRDNLADVVPYAHKFRTFIMDESSSFKSRSTLRWKTAKKLTPDMQYIWALTGTPAPNDLIDLWAPMFLIDGGKRLGKTLTEYRSRYFYPGNQLPNGIITNWILREGAEAKIHALLEDICISMASEGRIKIPDVTFNPVNVPLPPIAEKLYRTLRDTLVADLELIGGEVHTAGSAAILSSKLSQICAGFLYVDNADIREGAYDIIHYEKVSAVQEIVEGTGSPVLVFYRFKAEREMITSRLEGRVHSMDEPDVVKRWNAGKIPVLLAHPASAGHGLNLQDGGHTVVWSSLTWSLEEWLQGNKRVARQGQKHPVVIHLLLSPEPISLSISSHLKKAPKPVDGKIWASIEEKTAVQAALLAHLESPL